MILSDDCTVPSIKLLIKIVREKYLFLLCFVILQQELLLNDLHPILTSTPVPQQVAVDILDVGVDGGPTGDTARGHVGVCLWVNVLEAFPGHTRAKLWESKVKHWQMFF